MIQAEVNNNFEQVQSLIESGADIELHDDCRGKTALMWAVLRK
jgi:ankyrin repeat protein